MGGRGSRRVGFVLGFQGLIAKTEDSTRKTRRAPCREAEGRVATPAAEPALGDIYWQPESLPHPGPHGTGLT